MNGVRAMAIVGLLLSLTAPAVAQAPVGPAAAVTLPFAPPTGRKLRYETTQVRDGAAGKERYTIVREVQFVPADDGGYRMTSRASESFTDATGPSGDSFRISTALLADVEIGFRIDRVGKVIAVENTDAIWGRLPAIRDGQLAKAKSADGQVLIRRVFDALIALPLPARERMLREDPERLLAFAGRQAGAATPATETRETPTPFGGTIPVSVASGWVNVDADTALYRSTTRSGGPELDRRIADLARDLSAASDAAERAKLERELAAMGTLSFEETVDYTVSRHWGLITASQSVKHIRSAKGEQVVEEKRRFGDWVF